MKDRQQPVRIEVTDGAAIPDPRESKVVNAWSLAFCGALLVLILLWFHSKTGENGESVYTYREIMRFLFEPDPDRIFPFNHVPDALLVTFEITFLSFLCTIPLGILTGLGRLSRNRAVNLLASTYVEVIRGIPLLVQLFYIYYALGKIIQVPPTVSAVVAITVCYGAYMGEVVRAGIMSIPQGQTEAARSLGFNDAQTMWYVVLPQALRTILPPVGNEFIAMLKDTSLVSIIAVADLFRRAREYAAQTFDYFETYTVVALLYLLITLILSKGVSLMEGRLNYYERTRK